MDCVPFIYISTANHRGPVLDRINLLLNVGSKHTRADPRWTLASEEGLKTRLAQPEIPQPVLGCFHAGPNFAGLGIHDTKPS